MRKQDTPARHGLWAGARVWGSALAGVAWCLIAGLHIQAAPTAEQVLRFEPRQPGVDVSTPRPDERAGCKVELVKGSGRGSGWLLKDANGRPLRRFFDRNDDKQIDVWSYYKDGVEVYREMASKYTGPPDQFRWLNSAGSKWGVGSEGRITHWKVISPEEVSQEILQALVTHDFARLQALMVTEAELKALGLDGTEAERIRERIKGAAKVFEETVKKLPKLDAKTRWLHLETGVPQCVPAEQTGSRYDLIRHPHGTILYEAASGSDWIQTGEMIRVGAAWRITGAPVPGATPPEPAAGPGGVAGPVGNDPKLQKLLDELGKLDQAGSSLSVEPGPDARVAEHHLKRADLLEQIVAIVPAAQRDPWIRQVADSLSAAVQSSPPGQSAAEQRLQSLRAQLEKAMPKNDLTAYVVYRQLQAEYSRQISTQKDIGKVQETWLGKLTEFVKSYPNAEDTPDALLQLGMVNEFLNKKVEAENWYGQLASNFAESRQAAKARGAVRRLKLEGQRLTLTGPTLSDPGQTFDVARARGKVVVVYYWASWNSQAADDFVKLKGLLEAHRGKLEVVGVNLDNTTEEARAFLREHAAPGVQLHQDGGLESELATDYGIMVLPTLFLVDREGKVIQRNLHITGLEDEVKKLLK
jgi:thiol-disulfide isomerase/thioredoxin